MANEYRTSTATGPLMPLQWEGEQDQMNTGSSQQALRSMDWEPYQQGDLAVSTEGLVHRDNLQEHLARSIGRYIIAEFLIGTQGASYREGILVQVGSSYFVLYDERAGTTTTCDLFSLKFMTILRPGARPGRNLNIMNGQRMAGQMMAASQSNANQQMMEQWLGQGSPWETYQVRMG